MRTIFVTLLIAAITFSCSTTKTTAFIDGDGYLVGVAKRSDFEKEPFKHWFDEEYGYYELDMEVVNRIKPLLKNIKIKAVVATWCGDSRREVPAFYKILDVVDYNYKNLQMICVDREKTSTNNEQEGLNIERVPTFIFYKDGKEINRFVEYPRETLEKDILSILKEEGYKHSYLD